MTHTIVSRRQMLILAAIAAITASSLIAAFVIRFEFFIPPVEMYFLQRGVLLTLAVKLPIFYARRLNRGWFTFSGLEDLRRILQTVVLASCVFAAASHLWFQGGFSRSIYLLDFLFTLCGMCWMRILIRVARESRIAPPATPHNVLVYGAGTAGTALAREVLGNPKLGYRIEGFVDDATQLRGEMVLGLPVLGAGPDMAQIARRCAERGRRLDQVLIAIPTASHDQMKVLVSHCNAAGLHCRTLPAYADLLHGKHLSRQIRDIKLEDLLSRETVVLEEENIRSSIAGRNILITGAAGSIGSELATRVAEFEPAKLILFDNAESGLFRTDMALREAGHVFDIVPTIGDIRDRRDLETAIRKHSVHTVFHAAAYKHVPLMEGHVLQAAENNVIGSWNVAETAYDNGVGRCILISSDKAVNPANVMGATKRLAEMIFSSYQSDPTRTRFTAVRFGNVLGSNGSVVPTFQSQIARGGPVTVTHPETTRYFMTVKEAVQLVLQASTMSCGSDIFVLDMGEPVRILDLAKNVIRLAGLRPETDIAIAFTGLRPGEKLYEEISAAGENVAPTYHHKIKIFTGRPADRRSVERIIRDLHHLIALNDEEGILRLFREAVPEYNPDAGAPAARPEAAQGLRALTVHVGADNS